MPRGVVGKKSVPSRRNQHEDSQAQGSTGNGRLGADEDKSRIRRRHSNSMIDSTITVVVPADPPLERSSVTPARGGYQQVHRGSQATTTLPPYTNVRCRHLSANGSQLLHWFFNHPQVHPRRTVLRFQEEAGACTTWAI